MSIQAVLFDLDGTLLPMDQDVFVPDECLMVGNDVGDDMVAEELGIKIFC